MIKIIVPDIPPSNNKFMGRGSTKEQAFVYQAEKQRWLSLIAVCSKKIPQPIERARVYLTYYFPDKRRRDPDNYSGKFILDALVRLGFIVDDSFERIELILRGSKDKDNPRTEIMIVEK